MLSAAAVIYTQEESITVPLLPYIGMFCNDIFGGVFVLVRLLTKVHAPLVLLIAAAKEIVPEPGTHKARIVYIKSTTVYVPSSELGLSQPLLRQRVCPSSIKGGGGTLSCR